MSEARTEWLYHLSRVKDLDASIEERKRVLREYANTKPIQGDAVSIREGGVAARRDFWYQSLVAKDTILAELDDDRSKAVAKATMWGIAVLVMGG